MNALNFYATSEIDELAWPAQIHNVSLESPALDFFTDFKNIKPLVIESAISVVDVKKLMQKAHVRLKLVIDNNRQFVGIISDDDLTDLKLVQKISEGIPREEILLTDLMIPKKDLKALDYNEVSKSTIADVIAALKNSGQRHSLVVDRKTHKIRGIFSASDISRKLHLEIDIQDRPSFYKVFTATA